MYQRLTGHRVSNCDLFRDSLRTVYFSYLAVEGPEGMDSLVFFDKARGRLTKIPHGQTEDYSGALAPEARQRSTMGKKNW